MNGKASITFEYVLSDHVPYILFYLLWALHCSWLFRGPYRLVLLLWGFLGPLLECVVKLNGSSHDYKGLYMVPRSRNALTTQTLRRSRERLWFCVGF